MSHTHLVIDKSGARLTLSRPSTLRLVRADGSANRLGLKSIGSITVVGSSLVDTEVIQACALHGIPLTCLAHRPKNDSPILTPSNRGNLGRRLNQYQHYFDGVSRLELSKWIVSEKVTAQSNHLNIHGIDFSSDRILHRVSTARSVKTLMGFEGAATAQYFKQYRRLFDKAWGFRSRNRRPPKDPINALLSLSYTCALSAVSSTLVRRGLDPSVGFLHKASSQRLALSLDVIEPLRPVIDHWIDSMISLNKLSLSDFDQRRSDGVFLNDHGRKTFFRIWFGRYSSQLTPHIENTVNGLLQCLNDSNNQEQ